MLEETDLRRTQEFCKLVGATDLLSYLGLESGVDSEEAIEALGRERRRMQAMQNNPKYKEAARFFMKSHPAFRRVLHSPHEHLEYVRRQREEEQLPMLEVAIDSILADGEVTDTETTFVRRTANNLGVSLETMERLLKERAEAAGVDLAVKRKGPSGASGHAWWDPVFTRALLDVIPEGPGDMVDVYCRRGLSAATLLPQRPHMHWLGIDRNADRIEAARKSIGDNERVRFAVGQPDDVPVDDASVDMVLGVRALANLEDSRPVLAEARRVLRPGGRVVLAEPDGLAESFVFDEHLWHYNEALRRLNRVLDARVSASVPPEGRAGSSLGPTLAQRLVKARFHVSRVAVHASSVLKPRTFERFSRALRRYPVALASMRGLSPTSPEVNAVMGAVDELSERIPWDQRGMSGYVLPMYIVVGVKE